MFFYIKQKYNPSECIISDINQDLISTYIDVRDNPKLLMKYLAKFQEKNSKNFYYSTRSSFNKNQFKEIERSAAFIYLNKTCFNGLFRVNKKNRFNVPYGQNKNPKIFDENSIYFASELLNDRVKILHQDYRDIVSKVKKGDFVYLDPCYDPIKKTSFTNYTPERFSEIDRSALFSFIETLRIKGIKVVLSNNNIPEIKKLYSDSYKVNEILAPRFIGSKVNYRSGLIELVISTNF